MSTIQEKRIRSEPNRRYFEIDGFEIRSGQMYNYNLSLTPEKWEIRITNEDFELMQVLEEKIKEMLTK